jgi:hypothetical protein
MESPHFLFVGTAKAGTTSLHNYLIQHPQIEIPVKETFFFMKDIYQNQHLEYPYQRATEDLILNEHDFLKLYPQKENVVYGEIGTGYLYYHEEAIPLIKKHLGSEVRIVIILRNPVDRAYSSYMHFVKDAFEELSFKESMDEEEKRRKQGYDFMWLHKDLGLYANQVKAYLEAFEHVKVMTMESFLANRDRELKRLLDFIGVRTDVNISAQKKHNKSGEPRSKILQKALVHEHGLKKIVRPIFRALYSKEKRAAIRKRVKNMNIAGYPPMPESVRAELADFYKPDIARLEKILGRELLEWRHS